MVGVKRFWEVFLTPVGAGVTTVSRGLATYHLGTKFSHNQTHAEVRNKNNINQDEAQTGGVVTKFFLSLHRAKIFNP